MINELNFAWRWPDKGPIHGFSLITENVFTNRPDEVAVDGMARSAIRRPKNTDRKKIEESIL